VTVHVLISGTLFRDPQTKSSKAGKAFVTATIKTPTADSSTSDFWNCMCFSDSAKAALMCLRDGERVTVQGDLKLELFERDGGSKIGRTVFVSNVLALRPPPRDKKASGGGNAVTSLVSSSDLDDGVPF
jgi:single-stranded DNA-binding protein